jgi:hypothetical protein
VMAMWPQRYSLEKSRGSLAAGRPAVNVVAGYHADAFTAPCAAPRAIVRLMLRPDAARGAAQNSCPFWLLPGAWCP